MDILITKTEWKGWGCESYKAKTLIETTTEQAVSDGLITKDSDFHVEIKLKDLIRHDKLVEYFRLNPWCIAEGADGNALYKIHVKKLIQFRLVEFNSYYW